MIAQANKKKVDRDFNIGNLVLLKLQPHRQQTVVLRTSEKMTKRYYKPFKVLCHSGLVVYGLDLPPSNRIHLMVHVSQFRPYNGDNSKAHFTPLSSSLPELNLGEGDRSNSVLKSQLVETEEEKEREVSFVSEGKERKGRYVEELEREKIILRVMRRKDK